MEERRKTLRREADREMQRMVERFSKKPAAEAIRDRQLRRAIRHSCRAVVTMEIQHAVGGTGSIQSHRQPIPVRVLDLSKGGASIFSKHPMAHGEIFDIAIKTKDDRNIEAKAEVRWTKHKESKGGYAVGIAFTYVDTSSMEKLTAFLDDLDANLGM